MAEQKQKSFGLVVKSAKTKKQKEEKKLYTVVSCCVGAIFLLSILVPLLSNKSNKPSENSYKSVSFDLADLAVDDEAERILLDMQKYSDIPKQKIAGGLFDKKQKEERKEVDSKKGNPAPPDEEYRQARRVKQANRLKKTKGVSRSASYSQRPNTRTATGSLSKGGMVQTSGASSGVSSSIWTSKDKDRQKGARGSASGAFGTQQLVAATGAKGRHSGLIKAIEESQKGADSKNSDSAAQAAADAFTNNNLGAEGDDLKDGMDDLAEKFNAEEFKRLGNNKDLTDLANELDKEKDKADENADPCSKLANKMSWECYWGPALGDMLMDIVKTATNTAIEYAFDSRWSGSMNRNEKWLKDYAEQNKNLGLLDSQGHVVQQKPSGCTGSCGRHFNRYWKAYKIMHKGE